MNEKTKAVIAYIFGWIGGLIVLLAMKESNTRDTKMHAAQSIVISVGYFVISLAYGFLPITIPFFGTILWGLYIALIIIGIVKACKEQGAEIPVVSNIANSIFGKLINE